MNIPVRNLFYLLCYAWDTLPEGEIVAVDAETAVRLDELFASVLAGGVEHLLRQGLGRSYRDLTDEVPGIRGKVDLGATVKRDLLSRVRAVCTFDELVEDTLPNRIVKATLRNLVRLRDLDRRVQSRLGGLYRHFGMVADIRLTRSAFRSVQLHRNNRFYDFLLKVCLLIHDNLLVDEETGATRFRDFRRDEKAMARTFEAFVFNFLSREQSRYRVSRPHIEWHEARGRPADLEYVPLMKTDVVLHSRGRTLVIDTKFYLEAFQHAHGAEKIRSDNLYQLFAYLQNLRAEGPSDRTYEGMLLYPSVRRSFRIAFTTHGHRIQVRTVDLDRPWDEIRCEMLGIMEEP